MMTPTASELETMRLARLLKVDVERLAFLTVLPLEDLRTLRDQIASRLFDEGRDSFHRAAAVGNLVPSALAAKLAEHALGPVLSARTTAVVDTAKAVDLASRFSPSYLADVAEELDPRIVSDLVQALPPSVIATVGRELAARKRWLVMADFVGAITLAALTATVDALSGEAVLQISRLLEDRSRSDDILGRLDDDRIAELVAAANEYGLTEELAALADVVSDQQRARLPL